MSKISAKTVQQKKIKEGAFNCSIPSIPRMKKSRPKRKGQQSKEIIVNVMAQPV